MHYRGIEAIYDFVKNSFAPDPVNPPPAANANTLGEVPDGPFWTERQSPRRMTLDELRRGPGGDRPPHPPFTVTSGKLDGITPGFQMRDADKRLYFVKADPYTNPEMSSGADIIGSRFFYALGYNTPENYLVYVRSEDLELSPDATIKFSAARPTKMSRGDLEKTLRKAPRRRDGSYRLLASLAVRGDVIGPFRYEGARSDDPNDIYPHEDRRELRGLAVFCAWLNHTDAKSQNSLDAVVEEGDLRYVKHFLIDFGAILGSDSDMPKNARYGHESIIPRDGTALLGDMFDLGLNAKPWEKIDYPKIKSVGRFSSEDFTPDDWVPNYPNLAFLRRLPEDEFWAAKRVMAFSADEIRALVETGDYSDPRATEHLVTTLLARQKIIGRTIFAKLLPLTDFRITENRIEFDDLAVRYGFDARRSYRYRWAAFDNLSRNESPLEGDGPELPRQGENATGESYFVVTIESDSRPGQAVRAFVRSSGGAAKIVGVERSPALHASALSGA